MQLGAKTEQNQKRIYDDNILGRWGKEIWLYWWGERLNGNEYFRSYITLTMTLNPGHQS